MSDEHWAPAAPTPLEQVVAATSDPTPTQSGPAQVAGYTDLVEVGRGGDSIVYRAHQGSVGRDVAIKVIHVTDAATVARFRRELSITVTLGRQHPNIVNVLDTTTTAAGEPCLVMDFHDLGTLHERLRGHGPLPVSEVVAAGTAVADALAFAHSSGVLHRDVKPQNILLLPTSYVLSDFGIARMSDAGHTATMDRFSYRHASPQVLDGGEPTEADDVWSLGSTLFTLLDGRAPFASLDPHDDSALSYLRRVRTGQRRSLDRTDLPEGLREMIEGCLQHEPAARIPTAEHALGWLRSLRTEDRSWAPSQAAPDPVAPGHSDRDPGATRPRAVAAGLSGSASAAETLNTTPATAPAVTPPLAPSAPSPQAPAAEAPAAEAPPVELSATEAPASEAAAAPLPAPAAGLASLAPSALAHVESLSTPGSTDPAAAEEPGDPDAAATGMLREVEEAEGPGTDGSDADAAPGERRGRTVIRSVSFAGGALLVGLIIGVSWLLRGQAEEPEAPPPTEIDVPIDPDVVPDDTGPVQPTVGEARFAPRNPALVDNGTSVDLSWAEAEADVDYYMVIQIDEPGAEPHIVVQLSPTVTEYTVQGMDPDSTSECFAIAGYVSDDGQWRSGSSDLECRD